MSTTGPRRRTGGLVRTGAFLLSVVTVVLAGLLVPMPLVSSAPGSSEDIGPLLSVDAPTTELTGDLGLLTVRVDQPSILDTLVAWLDDHRDLRPRDHVIPGHVDQRDYLQQQRREFRRSFRVAAAVGLRAAGLETTVRTAPRVVGVLPDGPAAGVLRIGDVIRTFEGTPVTTTDQLVAAARDVELGQRLTLGIERDGEPRTVTVVAGRVPGLAQPGMGITLHTWEEDIELPVDIALVDQQGIGGPSAGMMIALTVYDLMSDEDLVAGRDVVGTGTVDGDGTVGPVGSIREKTYTAIEADADVMLVPATQAADAADAADGRIEVIGVSTVAEAIQVLGGGADRAR